MEIQTLNQIYKIANDEGLSEREALSVIMQIVEDRLSDFGMFPEGYDPNENS